VTESLIKNLGDLESYLHSALQLEHATIPPYLTALYSIHPGTNSDAVHVIRVVVVEEMLHLTLAANILNAVGGSPDLTAPHFVPQYPTALPDGETDFVVDLQPFSRAAVEAFLKIERPGKAPDEKSRLVRRKRTDAHLLAVTRGDEDMHFYSIGEFYAEILTGLRQLESEAVAAGGTIFTGAKEKQVTPEYFYSGGGEVIPVSDLESAEAAILLISEQGEGLGGGVYDSQHELAHFYRFEQLVKGRYYEPDNEPHEPRGPELAVDWDEVYPIKKNARLADYPDRSELRAAAVAFNESYAGFLGLLTRAYNGRPELLLDAVPDMFRVRDRMGQLIRNPIPGMDGVNAAPTFEITATGGAAPS
jgi:hypothetical protein